MAFPGFWPVSCLLLLVGIFPSARLRLRKASRPGSAYGDTVISSDGQPYYSPSGYYTMTYHDDGSTSIRITAGMWPTAIMC